MAMSLPIDPAPPSHTSQSEPDGIVHQHTLNKERQISKLIDNSSKKDIVIEVNCNEENVNICCNPGFYNLVARPCLLSITPGHQVYYKGITFELSSLTPQKDLLGVLLPQYSSLNLLWISWNTVSPSPCTTLLRKYKSKEQVVCLMGQRLQDLS